MRIPSLFILLLVGHLCAAQSFQLNDEEQFAYQVKQIDELIERFNGEEHTLVREYLGNKNTPSGMNRAVMIKTVFDSQKPNWNINEVKSFIDYVSNAKQPVLLGFEDDLWYADAKCSVNYNGKREKVHLIMKIQKEQNGGLKWVLVSAKSNILNQSTAEESLLIPFNGYSSSMNPVSHSTEFMGLDQALADTKNLASFVARDSKNPELVFFLNQLIDKKIVFEQVDSLVYHFLQINGWGFTVQKFKRPIKNSGWLVSSLTKMNQEKKQEYLRSVLNITK